MSAIAMKAALAKLAAQHGTPPPLPNIIPLGEPIHATEMILEGIATTASPNLDRSMFAAGALTWPTNCAEVPLYMRHDESKPVGRIRSLAYTPNGDLKVTCVVTDPKAMRMGGFSVGAQALEWQLHNENSRDHWAEITKGILMELSLTDRPADPRALVLRRSPPGAFDRYLDTFNSYASGALEVFELQKAAINKTREIVEHLMAISGVTPRSWMTASQMTASQPAPSVPSRELTTLGASAPHIYGSIPPRPRPRTEFGNLVEALNER